MIVKAFTIVNKYFYQTLKLFTIAQKTWLANSNTNKLRSMQTTWLDQLIWPLAAPQASKQRKTRKLVANQMKNLPDSCKVHAK